MTLTRKTWSRSAAAVLVLLLAACDNKPFEKAGKAVDGTVEKTGDKLKQIAR